MAYNHRIFVPIPKVTKEHRERLSKGAKQKYNETHVTVPKANTWNSTPVL